MRKIKHEDLTITVNDTQEIKDHVFDLLLTYIVENRVLSGETVYQSDRFSETIYEFMADIVDDVLKLNVKYDDD